MLYCAIDEGDRRERLTSTIGGSTAISIPEFGERVSASYLSFPEGNLYIVLSVCCTLAFETVTAHSDCCISICFQLCCLLYKLPEQYISTFAQYFSLGCYVVNNLLRFNNIFRRCC